MITVSPLIQPHEWIALSQHDASNLVLVDASAGPNAFENYKQQHLQGAIFANLETQLAEVGEDAALGGRHPLPTPESFSETLAHLGISPTSYVVIYDDKKGSNAAARFWWMLKAVGHTHVYVLDGGLQLALQAGIHTSQGENIPQYTTPYPTSDWALPQATLTDVQKASETNRTTIIDVRDTARYAGQHEPIDLIAGHIPTAINIPFVLNLHDDGTFKDKEALHALYAPFLSTVGPDNVIVHCGSGVTACHTLLAFASAGLPIPRLYVGSWSEWSRNNLPMITQKTN
ncbi:sulfurtransferase [Sphingobacterium sp. SYP-B4668]|uniref:sulfurtransferase n=1 Tax=Sphingobacterium sp. SYP-B4668 TaxID=2996035 RepID=UPI0022DE0B24|nr:sulfurtransferase [Sphingobacterium sp. SYP-B4668]